MAQLRLEAGDPRRAVTILEARMAAGDHSPATVAALARARADAGDPVGAAQLLQALAAQRPRDAAVFTALAGLQRTIGDAEGLTRTLERLQTLAPTAAQQRELARLYAAAGRTVEQRAALRRLVADKTAEVEDYLVLARLEAALGQPSAGVAALRALGGRRPGAVDASVVGLELSLLLASGEADQAFQRATDWLQRQRRDLAQAGPLLAGSLTMGGRPDLAAALLQPYAGMGAAPRLVTALAQAENDAGHPAAGLQRLEQLDATGGEENGQSALLRLRLALVVSDVDRILAAAERLGWPAVPDDLVSPVIAAALAAGQPAPLQRLAALDEARLAVAPVSAAELRLALGDAAEARRWSDRAAAAVAGRPDLALQLAALELRLGRRDRAGALLGPVLTDPALPAAALPTAARLFIRAGRAGEAATALATLRRDRPSPEAEMAWALVATAAGRGEAVAAWLAAPGRVGLPDALLRDLVHLAMDAGTRRPALALAERLAAASGRAEDGLLLIQLLLDAGQPRRALERLRALPAGAAVPETLREAVLMEAWRQGAPVQEEVRALARRRLAAAATPAEREAAVTLLLALQAHAELLPVLRTLALQAPERWLWAHGTAAAAAGREGEAVALWLELVGRPALPAALRRQLAFRLLEAGDKRAAERAFRTLAATAPPDSPDVRQLLFLWGPRPGAAELQWLEARGRQADAGEQAAWMRILTDRGAPARAIALYRAEARDSVPEPLLDAYLGALEAQDDRAALAAAVRAALPQARAAGPLRHLARLAARTGNTALEQQVLERLVATGESGPDVQYRLGALAYLRRDRETAERLLSGFVAATGGNAESWTLLGDLAAGRRETAVARQRYGEALRRIDAAGDRSRQARAARAHLLHCLGQETEAVRLYEALLAERPGDDTVRADYAAMLLGQGALQRAREILGSR
ncbi:tetratricopeptide repeat protein [Paracraurococcus lichenis]|uniref:Tetratricopeptide repeat protein n=1 Tax=Paracraurococcus lichenis TaxID=3064888 RepID=A0ABT9E6E6_9PROT|nr:tetratricopeptide repeat protein [Paracraurococcus sp. LOR1-02]MDO9711748.1 hypothetical protein [Paracraurococcus sp. LOR1-02]